MCIRDRPYYIASMNIEHEYVELTGQYEPFEGIALVDTFELAEGRQPSLFAKENTQRVQRQKDAPIFVIIGNPPYNAHQVNQNDNSKNRKYPVIDGRVAQTYAADSQATNKNPLSDPYIKAFRWAADRIGVEGVIAFISNNGFIDGVAFDGMRQHLAQDFDTIYLLDLGGNVRVNPKLSGTTHNVFGIQVGVCITLLVRRSEARTEQVRVFYARADEYWRKEEKYEFLEKAQDRQGVEWRELRPDNRNTWLTEGLVSDFENFIPLGNDETKREGLESAIFMNYSRGAETNRDSWAYNFDSQIVAQNMQTTIDYYNGQVAKYQLIPTKQPVDDFVSYDDRSISWSRNLKRDLSRGKLAEYSTEKLRKALYRPFSRQTLFFDRVMNQETGQWPKFFPSRESSNLVLCVTDRGSEKPFISLMTDRIADLHIVGAGSSGQCFPFYTYNRDGTNRRENITDWALARFRAVYGDSLETEFFLENSVSNPTTNPVSGGVLENSVSNPPTNPALETGFSRKNPVSGGEISKWDVFHYCLLYTSRCV